MAILEGQQLNKKFENLTAVDEVSFKVETGDIIGIIGPNGAGKSTLLDILTGFQFKTSGRAKLNKYNITKKTPERIAALGFVRTFQRPKYVGELSVWQNVLLATHSRAGESWIASLLKNKWLKQEKIYFKETDALLARIGLSDVKDMKSKDISFGQLKLQNIAMALMAKAEFIAFDEPVSGVAPSLQPIIAQLILNNKPKYGFIIIEHNFDFLRKIATKILLMNQGKIILNGTPDEVFNDPIALSVFSGEEVLL